MPKCAIVHDQVSVAGVVFAFKGQIVFRGGGVPGIKGPLAKVHGLARKRAKGQALRLGGPTRAVIARVTPRRIAAPPEKMVSPGCACLQAPVKCQKRGTDRARIGIIPRRRHIPVGAAPWRRRRRRGRGFHDRRQGRAIARRIEGTDRVAMQGELAPRPDVTKGDAVSTTSWCWAYSPRVVQWSMR